jgi:hypothetical protein
MKFFLMLACMASFIAIACSCDGPRPTRYHIRQYTGGKLLRAWIVTDYTISSGFVFFKENGEPVRVSGDIIITTYPWPKHAP